MNFGFNTNVRVEGTLYHVQTEDRGPSHPFLDTVVYLGGRVVHKRSTSYTGLTAGAAEPGQVVQELRALLAQQHREVIAELQAGTLGLAPKSKTAPEPDRILPQDSLELRLLNPDTWLANGNVTCKVEVRHTDAATSAASADVEAFFQCQGETSASFHAATDSAGRATFQFPLPSMVRDGAVLVIRAIEGGRAVELRFRVRNRRPEAAANPSSK
jgi:hypothetical protein